MMALTTKTLHRAIATLPYTVTAIDARLGLVCVLVDDAPVALRVTNIAVWGVPGTTRPFIGDLGRRGAWLRWAAPYREVAEPWTADSYYVIRPDCPAEVAEGVLQGGRRRRR